ncbi:transposase family protein [Actinomadura graeca]|uniref:Transposase family protein n=1 Tax=Actinomadura graeca TaxID=2750812 RepID=A0ABX8R3X4_9ACTN|nr:transposase family protein [Actinomadura graeca]
MLVHLRKGETFAQLGAGFEVSAPTAWRYVEEVVALLSSRSPKLTAALRRAVWDGLHLLVLDGTLIRTDRVKADRRPVRRDRPGRCPPGRFVRWSGVSQDLGPSRRLHHHVRSRLMYGQQDASSRAHRRLTRGPPTSVPDWHSDGTTPPLVTRREIAQWMPSNCENSNKMYGTKPAARRRSPS